MTNSIRSNLISFGTLALVFHGAGLIAPAQALAQEARSPYEALVRDPDSPAARADAARNKRRIELEQQMKRIRLKHFGNVRKPELRQAGIEQLKDFIEPLAFPALLSVFEREGRDVREAILDHLAGQKTEDADATMTWGAVFDQDEWFRDQALRRVKSRADETGSVSNKVKWSIAAGLKSPENAPLTAAARAAEVLQLFEAIPMIVASQVGGPSTSSTAWSGGANDPAAAQIVVGTQRSFVADLNPVVGQSAVAFDPVIGVLNEGTVLRVFDASVVTYHTEVHYALQRLSRSGWGGRSVDHLGWDQQKWLEWYHNELVPFRRAVEAEEAKLNKLERLAAEKSAEPAPASTADPADGGG
ncbi:MAG: hypothetical protein JNM07_06800 [Phycisphaerae bacterium]|nr:hypothetical protein [Phycisphaerae bacterium]